MSYYKAKFTINKIGKFQFYSGVIIGLGYSIVFNFLLRFVLRVSNFGIYIDDWNFVYKINAYYSLLIGFASIVFSFCYTTYLWMSKSVLIGNRKLKYRVVQSNSIWVLFIVLMFLLRMFSFFSTTTLTIQDDFPITGFLLPLFVYLYCWNLISRIYKCKKPFFIFTIMLLLLSLLLSII